MKRFAYYTCMLMIITFITSCRKELRMIVPSRTELLTGHSWKLASYGYDNNDSGVIDAAEENISDCEKNNIYQFYIDGSALLNTLCTGIAPESHFRWRFKDNDKQIEFSNSTTGNIAALTTEQMFLVFPEVTPHAILLRYERR